MIFTRCTFFAFYQRPEVNGVTIDSLEGLDILCAQLTRNPFAIAKLLVVFLVLLTPE